MKFHFSWRNVSRGQSPSSARRHSTWRPLTFLHKLQRKDRNNEATEYFTYHQGQLYAKINHCRLSLHKPLVQWRLQRWPECSAGSQHTDLECTKSRSTDLPLDHTRQCALRELKMCTALLLWVFSREEGMNDFISQPLKTSVTVVCIYMKHLMLLSALKKTVKSHTEEEASSG